MLVIRIDGDGEDVEGRLGDKGVRVAGLHADKMSELGTRRVLSAIEAFPGLRLQSIELVGCWHLFALPALDMPKLRSIRVVGSRLQALPDLRRCAEIEEIDLHDNQIGPSVGRMSEWIHPDCVVATIDLSYNKIHKVDDWNDAFPARAGLLSVDLSFNFLKHGPPPDLAEATTFVTHHNEIDVREYCRGVLYALEPATGRWTNPRTGEAMGAAGGSNPKEDNPYSSSTVLHRPLPDWPGAFSGGGGIMATANAPFAATTAWQVAIEDRFNGDVVRPRFDPVGGPRRVGRNADVARRVGRNADVAYTHNQSVHGTEVQKGAREALSRVYELARPHPVLPKTELLKQLRESLYRPEAGDGWWRRVLGMLRWIPWRPSSTASWRSIVASCDDEETAYGGRYTYCELLERVWAVIERHEHRELLRTRLRQEVDEGVGMCFTGRATRLLNALHGVVDGVHLGVSERDAMQARISRIIARRVPGIDEETKSGLRKELEQAIDECKSVMPGERDAWLEAFDD